MIGMVEGYTLKETTSLCPECLTILPARIYEKDGKVYIEKKCEKHGHFSELYWGCADMYRKASTFAMEGKGLVNPNIEKSNPACPLDCGLCKQHKSHTALANIAVTNRCDLNCWYCFFYAEKAGYVYEPTLEQFRKMVRTLRQAKPIPCNAVQLTGGEPTIRDDLLDIIRICKKEGMDHVQVNTDGIRISQDARLVKNMRMNGVNTLYLSFDGVTAKTNPKNHWEAPEAIENCRKATMGVVLVPTVIKGVNDHELGDIVRFGVKHIDTIRGVNFQPVSLVGRMPKEEREKHRITIPDTIMRLEEQTDGELVKEDFYAVPVVVPIARFLEAATNRAYYELSTHFSCGMATYLFKDGEKMIPITRFLDVDAFVNFLNDKTDQLNSGKNKYVVGAETLWKLKSFVNTAKQPKDLDLAKILFDVLLKKNYRSLSVFHHTTLFLGMMHFMDLYNYDIDRVEKCCIHYATPDEKVIPFCAFNVLPTFYRDKIQKRHGEHILEWERRTGQRLKNDLYKRSFNGEAEKV